MKIKFDRYIQISTIILVPVSIAVAGHLFGLQMKNAEIESLEKRFESEHNLEIAKQDANWRITKSELVYKFMDALTSSEEIKRKVAVEAIMIALPEDGPRIAAVIAKSDPNIDVKNSATHSIKRQILKIIKEMFSESKNERIAGTQTAISGWLNSEEFITTILKKSITQIQNTDGIWNTVIYLENTSTEYLSGHKNELEDLKASLQYYGGRDKTLERLDKNVLSKIP